MIDEHFDEQTMKDFDIDVSKSYIVSEKNEIDNEKRIGNQCLSDIVESHDTDVRPAHETQSLNIVPDSLEVHNTLQSGDNIDKAVNVDENESDDEPPSLRSIKSIAEKKKQKMIDSQKERELIGDFQKGESADAEDKKKDDTENIRKVNRYSNSNMNFHKPARVFQSKVNLRKEEKFISKSQKKNVSSSKKSTSYGRTDFRTRSQTPWVDDKLQRDVKELQILNEKERKNSSRIYQNFMTSQNKWKVEKEKLCSDHEKKVSELNKNIASLRKKLKAQGSTIGLKSGHVSPEDDIVEKLQKQHEIQETMISGFQEENKSLYSKLKEQEITLKDLEEQNNTAKKKLLLDIDSLKMTHLLEVEKLDKKLKWYAENQVMLDKDINELKEGRDEIKTLRATVEQLESNLKRAKNENAELKKELDNKANNVNWKPIHEPANMQTLPNLDSKHSPDFIEKTVDAQDERPLTIYLERRIKILENELEEKDNDNARRIRAIEQKYSILTLEFEDEIKKLENRISELNEINKTLKKPAIDIIDLEKSRKEYSIEMLDLKNQMDVKDEEIRVLNSKLCEIKNDDDKDTQPTKVNQKSVDLLKKKLKAKDVQIMELTEKNLFLEKDRKLLTDEIQGNIDLRNLGETFRRSPSKENTAKIKKDKEEIEEKYLASLSEIEHLKAYIEELQIEGEQKRLRYEAIDVKSQSEIRSLTEKYEEERRKCEEDYQKIIEKLKVDFAVEHSNSRVAELHAKVSGLEVIVDHMKATLEETRVERHKFNQLKVTEDSLQQKVSELKKELIEAQNLGTPGVQEYRMLVAKINSMEKNHYSREEKLQTIIESTKSKALTDIEEVEEKWRVKIRQKDTEILKFREELDGIIEVLEELQKQGVVLPSYDVSS